jgi:hypothetical protein
MKPVGVPTVDQPTPRAVPEVLTKFMADACALRADAFVTRPAAELPERERTLLVHAQDMTSTLARFHGSSLQVEILQERRVEGMYLREVFLRTLSEGTVVEYGVLAVELEQFGPAEREALEGGHMPLGALLHRFKIPFVSAPIRFFSVAGEALATTPLHPVKDTTCYGRFNLLAKPTGEPLAWILEILPPAAAISA